jgi:hypothetical protein
VFGAALVFAACSGNAAGSDPTDIVRPIFDGGDNQYPTSADVAGWIDHG